MNDDELKTLARDCDWTRLELESRNAVAERISKSAELYLLRALLEQGKTADLREQVGLALQKRPRATLRFLERAKDRIPDLYSEFANNSVFSDLNPEGAPTGLFSTRGRWPSVNVLEDREKLVSFLLDDIFSRAHFAMNPLPRDQIHIVTFGSCFAQNLYSRLLKRNIRASTLSLEETVNTTFANRDILRFLCEARSNATVVNVFGSEEAAQRAREKLLSFLRAATHVVITVGVAPAFFLKSGEYILLSSAKDMIKNENEVVWRMSTVEENKDNLLEMIRLLRKITPSTGVCLTLSPVPLSASFSADGVVYEDFLSKATLRMAIQEVLSIGHINVDYWPSFEVVKWLSPHSTWAAFGADDGVSRHPSSWLVDVIVDAFCKRITAH